MEYKLTKTQQGKQNLYVVTDQSGKVVLQKLRPNNYIACTIDGRYFFSRRDLIGKGEHGKMLNVADKLINSPEEVYKHILSCWEGYVLETWKRENPIEVWTDEKRKYGINLKKNLETIAYL